MYPYAVSYFTYKQIFGLCALGRAHAFRECCFHLAVAIVQVIYMSRERDAMTESRVYVHRLCRAGFPAMFRLLCSFFLLMQPFNQEATEEVIYR